MRRRSQPPTARVIGSRRLPAGPQPALHSTHPSPAAGLASSTALAVTAARAGPLRLRTRRLALHCQIARAALRTTKSHSDHVAASRRAPAARPLPVNVSQKPHAAPRERACVRGGAAQRARARCAPRHVPASHACRCIAQRTAASRDSIPATPSITPRRGHRRRRISGGRSR